MDYEKAFKEAYERASLRFGTNVANELFLEYKESKEERTRRKLIEFFSDWSKTKSHCWGIRVTDIMDWLEKQGEQKPFDYENATIVQKDFSPKEEPKFKVGDWVVWDNKISCHVDNIYQGKESLMYTITDTNNMTRSYSVKGFDNNARLWTIQDAKDGDVLFAENFDNIGGCVFLFKGLDSWKFDAEGDRAIATGYCCTSITESGNTDFGIQGPDCVEIKRVHPATKEQRDLLFQKMHEAGYMWNEEKKELEKIESTRPMLSDFFNAEYVRGKADALQSIEWSEEDEKTLNEIFSVAARASLRKSTLFGKSYDYIKWQNWLKSLKDRYTWKPSEEQMEALLYETEAWDENSANGMNLTSLYNDLKKL